MTPNRRLTLIATILASSMTFIDGTVVNVALPALQAALHASIVDVQWVVEAYALFLGALILVGGSLGDQLGRKRVFLAGVAGFALASALCGVATSPAALIVGRALQGIAAAFLVPGSLAIISATYEGAERGRAIGTWSAFSAITTAIGPVLGGWLIEHVSWRAAFFINVPLAIVVLALSLPYMAESRDPTRGRDIDWLGAALAAVGLGTIVFGLLELPSRGVRDAAVVAALAIGVCSLTAFLAVEHRSPHAMMPLTLFRSRAFTLTNGLTLLLYGALGVSMFLLPLNLINVQHYTATAAGASMLPMAIILFAGSRWTGALAARIGPRWPLTIGPAVAAAGVLLLARPAIGGSYWTTFFPAIVVLGLGMAITVAPLTSTVMSSLDERHAGVASGVNNAVSRVAGLLAIAVLGVVLSQAFTSRVQPRLASIALPAESRAAIGKELDKLAGADLTRIAGAAPPAVRAARRAIDESFVAAFRVVMVCAGGLALGGAVVGLFLDDPRATITT
jgi:EmrB/QacA subfamily drug resistance transporter